MAREVVKEWNKLSSNDRKLLRSVELALDSRKIHCRITNDNQDYPPTLWAWCERKFFYDLLNYQFGIHRR